MIEDGTGRLETDERPEVQQLFKNLQAALPELEELLQHCSSHWEYEDPVYRFYHQSFKVYYLQDMTLKIVSALQALCPDAPLNKWFMLIVEEGTGKTFSMERLRGNTTPAIKRKLQGFHIGRDKKILAYVKSM